MERVDVMVSGGFIWPFPSLIFEAGFHYVVAQAGL